MYNFIYNIYKLSVPRVAASGFQHSSHAAAHAPDQVVQEFLGNQVPLSLKQISQLPKVCRLSVTANSSAKAIPCVLDAVQIRGVGRPRQRLDALIPLEFLDNCSTVWRGVVILQDPVFRDCVRRSRQPSFFSVRSRVNLTISVIDCRQHLSAPSEAMLICACLT